MYFNIFGLIFLHYCIGFIIFFWFNKLFTDTISNIPLNIGVIFSVFHTYDNQLQDLDTRLQCLHW